MAACVEDQLGPQEQVKRSGPPPKKNPGTKPGLQAFFAVTHQGPAQGGKAGGGEPPGVKSNKNAHEMQVRATNRVETSINRGQNVQSWQSGPELQQRQNQAQFSP
jgi:hypothetical protein